MKLDLDPDVAARLARLLDGDLNKPVERFAVTMAAFSPVFATIAFFLWLAVSDLTGLAFWATLIFAPVPIFMIVALAMTYGYLYLRRVLHARRVLACPWLVE